MLSLHLLVGFYLGKQKLSPTEAKTDQPPPLFSAIPCPDAILTNNTSNSPLKGLSNSCKEPVRNHIVQDIKEDKEPINEQGQGVEQYYQGVGGQDTEQDRHGRQEDIGWICVRRQELIKEHHENRGITGLHWGQDRIASYGWPV